MTEHDDTLLPQTALFRESEDGKMLNDALNNLGHAATLFQQRIYEELEDREKEIRELQYTLNTQDRQMADLTNQLKLLQNDHSSLEAIREDCESARRRSEGACQDLQNELTRAQAGLKRLEELQKENESLKEQRYSLLQELEGLRSEIKKLEGLHLGRIEELQKHFAQEKTRFRDVQTSLENRIHQLTEQNSEEVNLRERLGREKRSLTEEMDRINAEKKGLREQIARESMALQEQLKASERRSQEHMRALEQKARKELVALERQKSDRIASLEKELAQGVRELSLRDHKISQMEAEFKRQLQIEKKEVENKMAQELDNAKRRYYLDLEKCKANKHGTKALENS
ncbi:MAG: hypothetical protein CSA35_08970 [Dethiosulfovibrio peptidovorans]|nr:MAG: hypothetical protein CSA35_08970 [Dethiosulfovibrio peptidovorans]